MTIPAKWWWTTAILVPMAVALIAIVPDLVDSGGRSDGSADTFTIGTEVYGNVTFNNTALIIQQASEAGIHLPSSFARRIEQATELMNAKEFDRAISLLEAAAVEAPVPALLNNLGAAYLAGGDPEAARRFLSDAAGNPAAGSNLGILSHAMSPPRDPRPEGAA